MDEVECVVVGAGVVGLAVARALALQGQEVLVLESQPAFGMGVSSRSSEVIHAGLYYPTGSLKAKLCTHGRELLYRYCAERAVGHQRCGKLVVATQAHQHAALQAIWHLALANGVPELAWLSAEQARELEPRLQASAAVLSPATGIVDTHALMLAMLGDLESQGGLLVTHTEVSRACCTGAGVELHMGDGSALRARHVVNAAGLQAPTLAAGFQGLPPQCVPTAHYAKGNYFSLVGRSPFSRLVYPVPEPGGLGIHLTLDLGGQARFGPDVQWTTRADDLQVDITRVATFEAGIRQYWPELPEGALTPAYAGMRPKIHAANELAMDFVIQGEATHGVPGLVNLFGIESPGLTSALAIGEYVAEMLEDRA
jgi:L-2-hydroxyglutarate oxidase LhgO